MRFFHPGLQIWSTNYIGMKSAKDSVTLDDIPEGEPQIPPAKIPRVALTPDVAEGCIVISFLVSFSPMPFGYCLSQS